MKITHCPLPHSSSCRPFAGVLPSTATLMWMPSIVVSIWDTSINGLTSVDEIAQGWFG
jgi:hypothetical protein